MKQILFVILLVMGSSTYAQKDTITASNLAYKMELQKTSGGTVQGFIKNMNDSLLYYSTQPEKLGSPISLLERAIPYAQIQSVYIKRKGAVGRGALIGGAIGFGLGLIGGFIDGDDPKDMWFSMSAGEKGIAYGLTAGCGGALIGVVVGALSGKRFNIQSQKPRFIELETFLAKKTKRVAVNY